MTKVRFEDSDVWKLSRSEQTEHKLLNCYTMVWAARCLNKSKEVAVFGYGTKNHSVYNILCYGGFGSWVSAAPHIREYRDKNNLIAEAATDDTGEKRGIAGEDVDSYVWKDNFKSTKAFEEFLTNIPYFVSIDDGVTYIEENTPELVAAYIEEYVSKRAA